MKKIKMKKFLCLSLITIVPFLMLTGCSGETVYAKTNTDKTITQFMQGIANDFEHCASALKSHMNNANFNTQALTSDTSARQHLNEKILDDTQKVNKEGLFASCFYQMYADNVSQQYIDMSFLADESLTTEECGQLQNFFVQLEEDDDNQKVYKYSLTGLENEKLNLPVQKASNQTLVDAVDNAILTWGNELLFTVSKQTSNIKVKVKSNFNMPTQSTVTTSLNNLNDSNLSITSSTVANNAVTVYYTIGSQSYIKVIEKNSANEKKVIKYEGTSLDNAITLGNYSYTFTNGDYDLINDFYLNFNADTSYIDCFTGSKASYNTRFEYYKTETGELLGRIYSKESAGRTVVTVILNSNLETGEFKYDYQKSTTGYTTLAEEKSLTNTLCKITEDDKALAKSKTLVAVEIINYVVSTHSITIDRANVDEE